ncbi:MAG: glycine zipper 2TM domain-containing protein [Epsilonproteobacteria bacterium]|nr:glycine zipper 2TM domain-containing protein [Campylobacterota bacterium]
MNKHMHMTVFLAALTVLPNCGKHEQEGRLVGAASGAAIGSSVAGKHDKATGTLLGGLIGSIVGGQAGRDADERSQRIQRRLQQQEMATLRHENQELRKSHIKWCCNCGQEVRLIGAQSCPLCGGELIREKYCHLCSTSFGPKSTYRFCPYCPKSTKLCMR